MCKVQVVGRCLCPALQYAIRGSHKILQDVYKKIVQCVQVVGRCLCPAAAARPRGGGAECGRRSPLSAAAAAHREATTGSEKQVSKDTLHCEPTSGHCWRHRAGDTEKQGDIGHIVKQRQNR